MLYFVLGLICGIIITLADIVFVLFLNSKIPKSIITETINWSEQKPKGELFEPESKAEQIINEQKQDLPLEKVL